MKGPVTDEMTKAVMVEAQELTDRMGPILKGRNPLVQGAALADATAIFLAGHAIEGNARKSAALRERILKIQINTIRKLTAMHVQRLHGGGNNEPRSR